MKYRLTDTAVKHAKPKPDGKPAKHTDGGGLYLLVNSTGKYWRFDYTHNSKRRTLALGIYPDIPLKVAREKHLTARQQLAAGQDPSEQKRAARDALVADSVNSFEAVANEWHKRFKPQWSEQHANNLTALLNNDLIPALGRRKISEIEPRDVLACLRKIESRGAISTAHRAKTCVGQVFRYAVATGRANRDQTADLKGALSPEMPVNFAAITEPAKIGRLMLDIRNYQGEMKTKTGLLMLAYTFQRPGEVRCMEWQEVNLEAAMWDIPANKMKSGLAHSVPLSRQVVKMLEDMKQLSRGFKYVFAARTDIRKPMGAVTLVGALRRIGYGSDEMTAHGFRALARTTLDEVLEFDERVIERQLSHSVKDALGSAYNRTKHIKKRVEMMQAWADYLDGLETAAAELIKA